ncbi:glycosyltransferase family 2 protein [Pontibacter qinzhouensis]|uniref:Glycosyltransferase family 2 protein n=1 Tax=Pontibacter qinzhouensis TaxID=2603253 RepID=A0A5C8K786_9BACT|nr:glycosyltransferase [Pontibacter qinzhouensis]TXK46758.1 glycosyltransferase family 2 protein [Pontibacter qinzhouensis]
MRLGITVVICTFNGAALLPPTLRHIAGQQVRPGIDWELLVVNNASTDNTAAVVKTEWNLAGKPVPLTLLHQPKLGLTYARELALEKARYEFIIFCDDDNWLAPDYLNRAYDLMLHNPLIGVLGGCGELIFEVPPPQWAVGHNLFANGPQSLRPGKVKHHVVYGAGCVVRKSSYKILVNSGFKSMLTDRKGKTLCAGGDYELCYAIALAGYDIWYDNSLRFKHFVPKERVQWSYYARLFRDGAQSYQVLVPYRIRVNMHSKSMVAFHAKYLSILLSYVLKLLYLLLSGLMARRASDEEKTISLKLISLKSKILSLKKYATMKENFIRIVAFEQANLAAIRRKKRAIRPFIKVWTKKIMPEVGNSSRM